MATVQVQQIKKSYGAVEAIRDFNLDIEDGEFCVFVGPSGCGKSTALKMLAGLEATSGGTISIGGRDVTELGPGKRDIAMVFQNYALYPHMSVRKNIGFGLKMHGMPANDINARVEDAARVLELMDEPLSNLDAKLRVQTRSEIVKLQKRLGVTTIYVTHDQTEALTMADKIVVMKGGEIQQVGTAEELFHTPRNIFVAGFIGSPGMNFFHGQVETGARGPVTRFGDAEIALPGKCAAMAGRDMVFGIRPEHLQVADSGPSIGLSLVENLGTEKILHFHTPAQNMLELDRSALANDEERDAQTMLIRVIDDRRYSDGEALNLSFPVDKIHVFDPDTNEVVG